MQRLRHIRQLSTVELVFSGATHTRFAHSVGVFYLATRVYDTLLNKRYSEVREDWPVLGEVYLLALQLAALFHDVGHGPWSHVYEIFCRRNPDFAGTRHEKMTERFIEQGIGKFQDIPVFLNKLVKDFEKKGVKNAEFLSPKNIAKMAVGAPPPVDSKYLFLSQIVSGEFDVDRMDYLRRDAYYTGVETGIVDIWEIIHSYTIAKDKIADIWTAKISSKAAEAIEVLLSTRDLAYRRVYCHRTHRAAQEMMIRALHEIHKKYAKDDLALLTDIELLEKFSDGNAFTKDVANRIMYRRIYDPLPFEIKAYQNLDESALRALNEYTNIKKKSDFENILKEMDALADTLGFPQEHRVIFDLYKVPLSKKDAFTSDYLYDEIDGKTKSLLELLPHLNLTHGEMDIAGTKIDLYERYLNEVTKLLIIIPFEYINYVAEELDKKYKEKQAEKEILVLEDEETKEILNNIYKEKLLPIIEKFISFIRIEQAQTKRKMLEKFEGNMKKYISEIAGIANIG